MKIVVVNANPRKKGALASLVEEASKGAMQSGAQLEELHLADLDIGYCRFCMTCYKDTESQIGRCVLDDDMGWILPRLKEADGYIMASQVSGGHANAIFKTFVERCTYTAGSSKGMFLWLKGVPVTRFSDRRRFAITIVTAGTVPTWMLKGCDLATGEMKEISFNGFNAEVIGTLYAGELTFKGLQRKSLEQSKRLGRALALKIRESSCSTS